MRSSWSWYGMSGGWRLKTEPHRDTANRLWNVADAPTT
jgi:hypothetical protein